MTIMADNSSEWRYERKYVISGRSFFEVEAIVKFHPAMFSEIYEQRYVNNVYLDSMGMANYQESVDGVMERRKYRLRWYGELYGSVEEPFLEIKRKHGSRGAKKRFRLAPFVFDKNFDRGHLQSVLERSPVPREVIFGASFLQMWLSNRYKRKYFMSANKKYRITIDSEIEYYVGAMGNGGFTGRNVEQINTVLELKYDPAEDTRVREITDVFPFRVSRNSKYVNGMDRIY